MHNRAIRTKWGVRKNGGVGGSSSAKGGAKRSVRTSGQGKGDNADPKQRFERYVEMAKAAASSGDAVESEKYYQYADHFLRLMKASAR